MDNQNLQLMLILFLSQNPQLVDQIRPVLTFWEEHDQALTAILEKLGSKQDVPPMSETNPPKEEVIHTQKRSPLQEIAGDEILRQINAYFSKDVQ